MKRKYYLRGLGFGILITALVFIFTGTPKISDEEIIKRAEELGYVKAEEQADSLGIKELLGTVTPAQEDDRHTVSLPEPSETPVPTLEPTPELTIVTDIPEPTPTEVPEPEPTVVPTETPTPEPTPTETPVPTATIVVEPGNTASMVCDKIEAAGIVEDGSVLKDYLINHGLADFINIGSYTLSKDMSLKEIAEILTK